MVKDDRPFTGHSRRVFLSCCLLLALVPLYGCPQKIVVQYYGAPSLAPGTRPEMNTAGFWIGKHPDPDVLIMTAQDIDAFNASIKEKTKAVYDLTRFSPTRSGAALRDSLQKTLDSIASKNYVHGNGKPVNDTVAAVEPLMAIQGIPATVTVHWAYVVRPCDQRLLPTAEPFFKSSTDTAIDRLQNNAMEMVTPVVVLHESADHAWYYIVSPFSEGWVRSECIALCPKDQMERYEAWAGFVVATAAKADLFIDPLQRRHLTSVQMGVRLPLLQKMDDDVVQVLVPARSEGGWCSFDAAYVPASQVNTGYLPYTPRAAITQAFRLLNAPYGWGGMYGEQDCSRFIQEVFATFGILMPRNSGQQAKAGSLIAAFDRTRSAQVRRETLTASARGGITTLQFPGHIMLYLGDVGGVPYAIHDLYAYTEPAGEDERLVSINKVAVTSLEIGEGTKKGSLLMRVAVAREVSLDMPSK
ncbi:MAG: SH3 domain-containing protein [Desulfobacterota bacterium]|nr:SH3 domain-containing protein [Thermodesulfobacteriota bacterium]